MPKETTAKDFQPLSQETILELLSGRNSLLMEESRNLVQRKEQILQNSCPNCGTPLVGATPSSPDKAFSGLAVNLVEICPVCKYRRPTS